VFVLCLAEDLLDAIFDTSLNLARSANSDIEARI
jgi:hypothetical protein